MTHANLSGIKHAVIEPVESPPPPEPSEDELRAMIDDRERQQSLGWDRLKRISTRVLIGGSAVVVIGFIVTGLNKDIAAVMFPEPLPTPAAPTSVFPGSPAAESDEVMLMRAAGIPLESAQPADGKIIDSEDIRLAMQLMQFMQGPPKRADRPAPDSTPKPDAGK